MPATSRRGYVENESAQRRVEQQKNVSLAHVGHEAVEASVLPSVKA